jgi:iron complex transport system permease protein
MVKPFPHPTYMTLGLLFGLFSTVVLSLCHGTVPISANDLWQALLRQGNPLYQTIIWELRLPRIAAGVIIGAALGLSGALLQGMLRNGLADPFVLGISSGAGVMGALGGLGGGNGNGGGGLWVGVYVYGHCD